MPIWASEPAELPAGPVVEHVAMATGKAHPVGRICRVILSASGIPGGETLTVLPDGLPLKLSKSSATMVVLSPKDPMAGRSHAGQGVSTSSAVWIRRDAAPGALVGTAAQVEAAQPDGGQPGTSGGGHGQRLPLAWFHLVPSLLEMAPVPKGGNITATKIFATLCWSTAFMQTISYHSGVFLDLKPVPPRGRDRCRRQRRGAGHSGRSRFRAARKGDQGGPGGCRKRACWSSSRSSAFATLARPVARRVDSSGGSAPRRQGSGGRRPQRAHLRAVGSAP
jgi:hypothetical protein